MPSQPLHPVRRAALAKLGAALREGRTRAGLSQPRAAALPRRLAQPPDRIATPPPVPTPASRSSITSSCRGVGWCRYCCASGDAGLSLGDRCWRAQAWASRAYRCLISPAFARSDVEAMRRRVALDLHDDRDALSRADPSRRCRREDDVVFGDAVACSAEMCPSRSTISAHRSWAARSRARCRLPAARETARMTSEVQTAASAVSGVMRHFSTSRIGSFPSLCPGPSAWRGRMPGTDPRVASREYPFPFSGWHELAARPAGHSQPDPAPPGRTGTSEPHAQPRHHATPVENLNTLDHGGSC
jgi:hypothetical protein